MVVDIREAGKESEQLKANAVIVLNYVDAGHWSISLRGVLPPTCVAIDHDGHTDVFMANASDSVEEFLRRIRERAKE